jgi:hypothetical protein
MGSNPSPLIVLWCCHRLPLAADATTDCRHPPPHCRPQLCSRSGCPAPRATRCCWSAPAMRARRRCCTSCVTAAHTSALWPPWCPQKPTGSSPQRRCILPAPRCIPFPAEPPQGCGCCWSSRSTHRTALQQQHQSHIAPLRAQPCPHSPSLLTGPARTSHTAGLRRHLRPPRAAGRHPGPPTCAEAGGAVCWARCGSCVCG